MLFAVNFILWIIQALFILGSINLSLHTKWNRARQEAAAAAVLLTAALASWVKLGSRMGSAVFVAVTILNIAVILIYTISAFREPLWKKLLLFLMIGSVEILSEMIVTIFFHADERMGLLHMANPLAVNASITGLQGILLYAAAWVMNRSVSDSVEGYHYIFYLLFPVGQFLLCMAAEKRRMTAFKMGVCREDPLALIGALISVAADFWLIYLVLWNERREKIRYENEELKRLRELESEHFKELETKEHEFAKLRHDYKNQMLTAAALIRQGDADKAAENLENLFQILQYDAHHDEYSANHIINAVMAEKAAECREKKITLSTELNVGEIPGIKSVALCSVFSNLMDNAVRAAAECSREPVYIRIQASVKQGYLIIRVENTSDDPEIRQKLTARKGYGREILRDIAEEYQGGYSSGWKDGIYTADIIMKTKEK